MDYSQIAERFSTGKIKGRELETVVFTELFAGDATKINDACHIAGIIRCEDVEKRTGKNLSLIKQSRIDNAMAGAEGSLLTGIEMKVGAALVPMGIAGPLKIKGRYADGEYYIPLATNEAALVAGVQRGIKAINKAGGITTLVREDSMARAPMIEAPDIYEADKFVKEIQQNQSTLTADLGRFAGDPFVNLIKIDPYQIGVKVILRLSFKTGDAMGMNGVTKASADIIREVLKRKEGWKLVTISSNVCTDKKAAHINVLNGRGKSVETEVIVPAEVLTEVFKKGVTPRSVEKVVFHKCYLGSSFSGTLTGFNVNAANTIAAFFAATGQDLAQVITSSSCFIQAEEIGDNLRFTASLPSLEVATIGGGAAFGTAKEALSLIDCAGCGTSPEDNNHVMRLAEICAAAVTALDLNTACAQAAGYEMADSHVRLARGEKA